MCKTFVHTCKYLSLLILIYLIVLRILMYMYIFLFYDYFMISTIWDLYLDKFSVWKKWIFMKPKEKRFTDFHTKIKITLCPLFCTQNNKISLFGSTSNHKRMCASSTESQIFTTWCQNSHNTSKKKWMKQHSWMSGGLAYTVNQWCS